jgi:MscS family membrane protein
MTTFSNLPHFVQSGYIKAIVILVVFILLAKIADIFIDRILLRLTKKTKIEIDEQIIAFLHRPVYHTIILLGTLQAIGYLGPPKMVDFYMSGFLQSVIVVIWSFVLVKITDLLFEQARRKTADVARISREILPLLQNTTRVIVIGTGVAIFLAVWEINVTPLLASAGIAGVAVALAAKDTLANFFGGISIFVDRPYKLGDYVILDSGERGEVVDIGVRSTRLKTRDDVSISIPNSIMANTKIVNESAPIPRFRLRVRVGVAYGSDVGKVEGILLKIAHENGLVVKDPSPRVRFRDFGDSSLDFELLCWVNAPALKGRAVHELNKAIYNAFNEQGIQIPFPQRDLHIHPTQGGQD